VFLNGNSDDDDDDDGNVEGYGYVSELRPPTDLLFILQVIYGHGAPWWNDIERGK
jgi:hypothetical protein